MIDYHTEAEVVNDGRRESAIFQRDTRFCPSQPKPARCPGGEMRADTPALPEYCEAST